MQNSVHDCPGMLTLLSCIPSLYDLQLKFIAIVPFKSTADHVSCSYWKTNILRLCRVPCGKSFLRTSAAAMCVSSVGGGSTSWNVSAQRESFSIAAALSVTTVEPPSVCPPTPSMLRTVRNLDKCYHLS